jgi:hypothetical protein
MSTSHSASGRDGSGLINRRQLLQGISGLAALAAAGSVTPAFALASPPDAGSPSSPTTAATPASASNSVDMPFRSPTEATGDCTQRRNSLGCQNTAGPSALEKILGDTSLADSRLGLGNWHILDETEDPHLGHFTFPISPFNLTADDGVEQYLLFSNSQVVANFRRADFLEQTQRRMFDRAVWAMHQGRVGTAVVEFDRAVTGQKVDRIVRILGYYGVRTIVWGNELNDPNTPWRDDLPALFDILTEASNARKRYGLNDVDLSLPGLAYYGHGEYMQKTLATFMDLQRKKFPSAPNDLPVQRVADHYYGPVEGLLQRIQAIRGIMASTGATQLKYDLTEMGNPTLDPNQQRASDQQVAEGYIPQVASIAIGSGQVDKISYYSLLDLTNGHSVMDVVDGRLVKKPTYQSFVVSAKLLARLKTLAVIDEGNLVRVDGRRTDGIAFQILWSKKQDQDIWTSLPAGARVFDALGQEIKEDKPGQVALRRSQHPALGGPARITVLQ